jgi:fucose 4-O-acetylase-like acetyltransferase
MSPRQTAVCPPSQSSGPTDRPEDREATESCSEASITTDPTVSVVTQMSKETRNSGRDASVDVARGISIFAIVITHVLRGLNAGHLLGNGAWIAATDRTLCLWELSIFAFLGGIFVAKSVGKRSMRMYLQERTFQFMVLYLLWTVLQGGVQLLASGVVNNPGSIVYAFRVWAPSGQLWYLPWLVLATLVFVPMKPWLPGRAPWVFGLAAALSVAFWGLDGGAIGTQGIGLVVFYVGGMIVGVDRVRSALQSTPFAAAAVGGVALVALGTIIAVYTLPTAPTIGWSERTVSTVALGVVLSVVLSAGVLLVARAVRSWGFLAYCGQRSLDIFLAHIIMASGSRIVLVHLGVHSVVLLVAVGEIVGVGGPLVLSAALRRIGLAWVFDGPKLPNRARKRSSDSRPA